MNLKDSTELIIALRMKVRKLEKRRERLLAEYEEVKKQTDALSRKCEQQLQKYDAVLSPLMKMEAIVTKNREQMDVAREENAQLKQQIKEISAQLEVDGVGIEPIERIPPELIDEYKTLLMELTELPKNDLPDAPSVRISILTNPDGRFCSDEIEALTAQLKAFDLSFDEMDLEKKRAYIQLLLKTKHVAECLKKEISTLDYEISTSDEVERARIRRRRAVFDLTALTLRVQEKNPFLIQKYKFKEES